MFRFGLALLLLCCGPVAAQTNTQQLSQCLADTTSGKDRKDLARWVFFAIASHPEIKQFTTPSAAGAEAETTKTIADLVTRLLAESCMRQAQAAFKDSGAKAIETAFETLGQLAMQELTTNPDVNASMARFEKSLDQNKLIKVFAAN